MKNQLRIIGGQYKRRLLPFSSANGLRPTPDRVRETLFNWLMWDIQNARVIDVCAGSGALGFEALSRGAKQVILIEPNLEQVKLLQQNVALLNIENCQIIAQTAQQALMHLQAPFDVVFLDPPYSLNLWSTLATQLDPLLAHGALIYVEADQHLDTLGLPVSWQMIKDTKAGSVRAGLFKVDRL